MVIPSVYHKAMLAELHTEHSGISQTKSLAHSYLWWPGMDAAIENMVQKCPECQSLKNQPPVTPLHPWPWPTRIWQRIHIDFAEKSGKYVSARKVATLPFSPLKKRPEFGFAVRDSLCLCLIIHS